MTSKSKQTHRDTRQTPKPSTPARRWRTGACGSLSFGGVLITSVLIGCSSNGEQQTGVASPRGFSATSSSSSVSGSRAASSQPSNGPPAASRKPPPLSALERYPSPDWCPDDMVGVEGKYCTKLKQKCLRRRKKRQCAEWESEAVCDSKEVSTRYCVDRYEYPNKKGEMATVMVDFNVAKRTCAGLGKRLCTESEWTLACEGPKRTGFPYGDVRDSTLCSIDKPSPLVNERRLFNRRTRQAELDRLDQREPSGSRDTCHSAYGVFDLTGNVDEWVVNPNGRPYVSSLKGGNWGEYRNACRPVTRGHGPGFYYYQIGFRCCRAPLDPAR